MRRFILYHVVIVLSLLMCGVLTPLFILGQQAISEEQQDFSYAQMLYDDGMYDLAASKFQSYAEQYPMSMKAPESLLRAGESFAKLADYQRAIDLYRKLVLRFPDASVLDQGQLNMGECYQKLGRYNEAGIAFERVYIFTPNSELAPVSLLKAGQAFLKAADIRKAQDVVFLLFEKYPTSPLRFEARYVLAKTHIQTGNPFQALKELEKISGEKLTDDLAQRASFLKAEILQGLGQLREAEAEFRRIVESDIKSDVTAQAADQLAKWLLRRGNYSQAQSIVSRGLSAVQSDSLRSSIQILKGDILFAQEQYQEAIKIFENISSASFTPQQNLMLLFRIGIVYEKIGNLDQSAQAFKTIVTSPDTFAAIGEIHRQSLMHLVDVMSKNRQAEDAAMLLNQQQNKASKEFWSDVLWMNLAQIRQTYQKDYSGAIRAYSMLIESYPKSKFVDRAQFEIARCLEELREYKRAQNEYAVLVKRYSASEFANAARERSRFIDTFISKSSVDANEQMSTMLAQVALGEVENISALQLADLNFHVFRNYELALKLYRKALSAKAAKNIRLDEIAYKIAMCHRALVEKAAITNDIEKIRAHSDSLTQIIELLVKKAPRSNWVARANRDLVTSMIESVQAAENRLAMLDTLYQHLNDDVKWDSLRVFIPLELAKTLIQQTQQTAEVSLWQRSIQLCDTLLIYGRLTPLEAADAQYTRFQGFILLGDTAKAIPVLEQFVKSYSMDSRAAEVTFTLAMMKTKLGQYDDARELLNELTGRFYYTEYADRAKLELCKLMINEGAPQQAIGCLRHLYSPLKNELWLYLNSNNWKELEWALASAYSMSGERANAEQWLMKLANECDQCPTRARAIWKLAELAEKRDDKETALTRYLELEKEFPDDSLSAIALVRAGDILFSKDEWASANENYLKAKSRLRGQLLVHCMKRIAMSYYNMGNFSKAETALKRFKKSIDDDEAVAEILYAKGNYYLDKKNFKSAEKTFKQLTGKYKQTLAGAKAELGLGRMYVILNKTDDALKTLTGIPTKYSNPEVVAKAYISLGDFYYQNRQLDNAIFAFRKALDLKVTGSERASALRYLIRCYDDVQFWDRAISLAREYVESYPKADDVFAKRIQIGVFLLNLKEYDRGIAYLKDLKRQADSETEAEIQYWIGKGYLNMGRLQDAIAELLKVKYTSPPTELPWAVTAVYESARAYQRLGKFAEAKKLYEQVVREQGAESRFGRVARERIKEIEDAGGPTL